MSNTIMQAAVDIIDSSPLSPEDRAVWKDVLERTPDALLANFVELAKDDADLLALMTSNLKQKVAAFKSGEGWDAIIADERRMLQSSLTN